MTNINFDFWLKVIVEGIFLLSERERIVLSKRFGLETGETQTLGEVGKHFHVTRERIRQIEAKAIRKLKTVCRLIEMKVNQ